MSTPPLNVEWVRASAYCSASHDPMEAVYDRINAGQWAAGKHYKRTGPRTLWINIPAVTQWINNQPHVESTHFPRGSKSDRENGVTASA